MFNRKKSGFIIIHNEELSFMTPDLNKGWHCIESFSISGFLNPELSIDRPLKKLRDYDFSLMIVPDFWFGSKNYDFHSKDKNAIESFISRKLKQEFPENSEIQSLFSYKILKQEKGRQELVTLFLQDPQAGELCSGLARCNIRPVRISSPALLWSRRLAGTVESFDEAGTGLVYLLDNECYLLFYSQGSFLFSRTIPLPETGDDTTSRYESLSFEINQSAYHFSQRTKSQLTKLFLIPEEDTDQTEVKKIIGRDITILDESFEGKHFNDELSKSLGLCADFTSEELFPSEKVPGISDRILKNEIETRKIQLAGIIVGLFLLLILGGEFLFLHNAWQNETANSYRSEENPREKIEQYNEALDALLYDAEKEKPLIIIGKLAASLPENIFFDSIEIEVDPTHSLNFRGYIKADKVEAFNSALTNLVANINNNLKCSNNLSIDDIEIEIAGKQSLQIYNISFYLDLI